jgi:hypothetical protein
MNLLEFYRRSNIDDGELGMTFPFFAKIMAPDGIRTEGIAHGDQSGL